MSNKPNTGPRNFGVFLSQIEDGVLQADLSEELQRANLELAKHAENHGKATGTITLVLALKHDRNGVVDVGAEIKSKMPKSSRARSVFWADPITGNLSNKNPKQESLPFKAIAADSPAKDLGGPTVAREVSNG